MFSYLDVQNEVWWQLCNLKPLQEILLVCFVFLFRLPIELGQQAVQVNLNRLKPLVACFAYLKLEPNTCGIMFSLNSSWKRGGGGRSQVKYRNGDSDTVS